MTKTIGVVMDSIESITPYKDTTFLLLLTAQTRGWKIMYMEQNDLYLNNNVPSASMVELKVQDDEAKWFSKDDVESQPLSNLNVILMRKDPPFNTEYIYTTYILEAAEKLGVTVINKPQSLRDYNEKIFSSLFPQCIPPLIVSSHSGKIKEFLKKLKLNKYYEHIPNIIHKITDNKQLIISPELEVNLISMFNQIQEPFDKHCPKNRKNFLSYSYTLYKFFQLLDKKEFLVYFPLLKSREKLFEQENIWKNICKELNWDFIKCI